MLVIFAGDPVVATLEVFLLPDRDCFLDPVDGAEGGSEGVLAVSGGDGD